MPRTAILSGVLLILIGIMGYFFSLADGNRSWTALIPAIFGMVLAILGYAAKAAESLRKHLMHAAVLLALIGFVIPLYRIVSKMNDFMISLALLSQIAMSLICLVFVIISVKSFIDARKNRIE